MRQARSKRQGGYMERGISALIVDSATLSRLEGEPPKTPELRVESDSTETDDDSFVTTSHPWTETWNGQDLNIRFGHGTKVPFERPFVATGDEDHELIADKDDENLFRDSISKSRLFLDPNRSISQRSLGRIEENTKPPPLEPTVNNDLFHSSLPDRGKIMTAAQFESYREVKGRQDSSQADEESHGDGRDDDSDNEDEAAISKRHRNERRKQEAHIINYRKNMIKTTGDPNLLLTRSALSTPPSPPQDDDVPLALLQVRRRPSGSSRPPTRLDNPKPNPSLRSTIQQPVRRPSTARSIASQQPTRRPSTARSVASQHGPSRGPSTGQSKASQNPNSPLPVFARGLPHDPFGANNRNVPSGAVYPPQAQQSLYPGGLVSVIAIEQRDRAMRRRAQSRAPKMNPQQNHMHWGGGAPAYPYGQASSMYGAPGMQQPQMRMSHAQPAPSLRSDMQSQIMQQTAQNLNSQLWLMQMMNCMNQQGNPSFAPMPQQPWQGYNPMPQVNGFPVPPPAPVESFSTLPGYANAGMGPAGMDYAAFQAAQQFRVNMSTHRPGTMYTPSIAPSERSNVGLPSRYRPGTVYTPSIAPSERSTVGLPSRYRPVSKAASQRGIDTNTPTKETSSINSYLGATGGDTTSVTQSGSSGFGSGQSEQGTRVKKEKKDKRRAMWMGKRETSDTSCATLGCFSSQSPSQSPEESRYHNRQWGR
ncbi:Hypothetical protein NCS54_00968500 [Fusarium falciforme]|uniref:Hypothetical protein n=1 Tax=Fusarium falciforme TaxID=195108 RepID=UPI0022FFED2F|nr:Hypothetical protein NCS54_00968500 [Fusarium falciforme]WAO92189.1 Hypothetical protein NCS54_00968500 [Fusarium falciforme]